MKLSYCLIPVFFLLSACARDSIEYQPLPTASQAESEKYSSIKAAGNYSALKLSGDYATYKPLEAFIDRMARKHGFERDYLKGLFSVAKRKQWTLNYLGKEPAPKAGGVPKPGAWTQYRSQFLTDKHIEGGADFWNRHTQALQRASELYGVPPEYIIGIMGVETIYGQNVGKHRVLDALTTLAFDYPRRADFFADELEKFLVMTRFEGVDPVKPLGSYAGAMGLGQFMPSSYLNWAVDFNSDGQKDLWQPEDVIGSIANYFAEHGWRAGEAVVMPTSLKNQQNLATGLEVQYSKTELDQQGVHVAQPLPEGVSLRLLRLRAKEGDEYWLGLPNFYVITRYNHSTHYAMAVHQLAQAVKQRHLGVLQ